MEAGRAVPSIQAPTPQERADQHRRLLAVGPVLRAAGYSTRLVRDSHYPGEHAVGVAPPRCPGTPLLTVRWRPGVNGAWRYEVLAGDIATTNTADLVKALDELFNVQRHRGENQ